MNHANEIDKLRARYKSHKPQLLRKTAGIALAFFEESFAQQGFTDVNLQPWPKRLQNNGQALLVDTGALKKSLKIKSAGGSQAVIGTADLPYAQIQNDGGRIRITPKMRRFFWAMYYQALSGSTEAQSHKGQAHKAKGHAGHAAAGHKGKGHAAGQGKHGGHAHAHAGKASLSEQAQFYKNLAITTEEFITIPKRQHIGQSAALEGKINSCITTELDKIFNG